MAEHPIYLPFTFTTNSWQFTTVYDAKKDVVCRFDLEDWNVTEDNQGELEEDQAALVGFIVKAVNSYEASQELLTDIWFHFSATSDPTLRGIADRARELLGDVGQSR